MNPIKLNLWICIACTLLWIFTFLYHSIAIRMQKKSMGKLGQKPENARSGYVATIIVCATVCLLPYLILFKPYITAVLEGCGILGTWSLMKERLENLRNQAEKSCGKQDTHSR